MSSFPDDAIAYLYDDNDVAYGLGQLSWVKDASGETEFQAYDKRGRLLSYAKRIIAGPNLEEATFAYTYDAADHVDTVTYPDLEMVKSTYDASGQLKRLHSLTYVGEGTEYLKGLTYDLYGRPRQLDHGIAPATAAVRETREYWGAEKNFQLKRLRIQHTGSTMTAPTCPGETNSDYMDLTYADYTPTGRLKRIDDIHNGCTQLSNQATYSYDGLGRLTGVSDSQNNGTYDHDQLGNLKLKEGVTLQYANQYRPHQLTTVSGNSLQYDANGNRWNTTSHIYKFDADDRLREIDSSVVDITYDYAGKQVKRDGPGGIVRYFSPLAEYGPSPVLRKYYFAGSVRIASWDVSWYPQIATAPGESSIRLAKAPGASAAVVLLLDERAQNRLRLGALLLVGTLLFWPSRRRGAFGLRVRRGHALLLIVVWATGSLPLPLILQPLTAKPAWAGGGGGGGGGYVSILNHFHSDHLGSTQMVTTSSGQIREHVRYRTYGSIRGRYEADLTGTAADYRYEFTGYETETYTGLQYAGARFYDPETGSFITHDPIRQLGSPYNYTAWDPVNLTDPSGTEPISLGVLFLIGFAIGFAVSAAQTAANGGSFGQALTAGLIGGAIGGVTAVGLGVIGNAIQTSPVLTLAFRLASIGSGAYGTISSFQSGQYVAGAVGAVLLAYGLYSMSTETGETGRGVSVEEMEELYSAKFTPAQATTTRAGSSDERLAQILVGETEALYGPGNPDALETARTDAAHVLLNIEDAGGRLGRPITADPRPITAANRTGYQSSLRAVRAARGERSLGFDPTNGARHFNLRNTADFRPFMNRYSVVSQHGPFWNDAYSATTRPYGTDVGGVRSWTYINIYE